MLRLHTTVLYICCFLTTSLSIAKSQNTNSSNSISDANKGQKLYQSLFDNDLNYINGREYKPYHYPTKDTPYLNGCKGVGSIFIDGEEYSEKQVFYDLYKDDLVVIPNHFDFSNVYIEINKSIVDSFHIAFDKEAYSLINIKNNGNNKGLEPGFYEQIYHKIKVSLLLKHLVKKGNTDGYTTYDYEIKRFLIFQGSHHDITRKKKLLALFPDSKKKVKKAIKSINHSYKKMSNHQLIQLVKQIDTF